ncbi:hypothetical protein EWM64_g9023 [Hericium alpestre]|uniref:Carboxylic ester hydrolase n=1 Tax=Hericium alpestre TaxID=135208 RepID=A0A4Y9ZNI6_9AGAM|nr:hypothetical protein EWM64_g9023 [Hericium alpestre]
MSSRQALSGVPYGCFEGPDLWNSARATGRIINTPQQWGDLIRSGYPGYTGPHPRFQFWHGTADTSCTRRTSGKTSSSGRTSSTSARLRLRTSRTGYSRASFGPNVQAILVQGVGHTMPEQANDVLNWFGLSNLQPGPDNPTGPTSSPGTSTSTPQWPDVDCASNWPHGAALGPVWRSRVDWADWLVLSFV